MPIGISSAFKSLFLPGPAGQLECLRLSPAGHSPRGIALVAHPNPKDGGNFTNKVVHTLAKTLARLGYTAYCPNLRGVGCSTGTQSGGEHEPEDMAAVLAYAQQEHAVHRLILVGFSFGAYVQAQFQTRYPQTLDALILVGPAVNRYPFPSVPPDTTVIHGENDDVVPLPAVLDWARPQALPLIVVPGVGHFFHGALITLAGIVERQMRAYTRFGNNIAF